MCVDGTDDSGTHVGCAVKFSLGDNSPGEECAWTGSEAAQWYSNVRYGCTKCGSILDIISSCQMDLIFVSSCKDV